MAIGSASTAPPIYAVDQNGNFWKSTNSAASWTSSASPIDSGGLSSITLDFNNPSNIFLGGVHGSLYASTNSGASFTAATINSPSNYFVTSIVVDPNSSSMVYAASGSGLYRSTNTGANFNEWYGGGTLILNQAAIDLHSSSTIYLGTLGAYILKTTNSGTTFTMLSDGFGSLSYVPGIAINPANSAVVYALTGRGVFKSTSGGQ